ncbi:MAG: protein-glutamine gamma-glutamyltransferase [Oscillospiraceae bacterium]|nr:protein-glutamine gamma-glutamyltransferase [Oscillospiraceae bacterium]
MITVAGAPLDTTTLERTFAEASVQNKLLEQMSKSSVNYPFDDLNLLKFELDMRNEIVNAAYALNDSDLNFSNFHNARCNPRYWDRTGNGGFGLKRGAEPAAAINDIFINGGRYATECATAMMIVYYKALLEVYGAKLFNATFPQIYLMNWVIREPLLYQVGLPEKVDDMLLGDRGYFMNYDVNPQTPQWQGENVIVLPNALYYGHGIGITTADEIIASLNANRRKNATHAAFFTDTAARPDFKQLEGKLTAGDAVPASSTGTLVWKPFPPPIGAV